MNEEQRRIAAAKNDPDGWRLWGPYLSERAWGTVREDYSADGDAWGYFPHDHARSRAFRWGEDGLAGLSDIRQLLCFSVALWNGHDPILKERLFGLTGPQGNHGEDVKEYYYYLDATPSHSYLSFLYKYPHRAYPYQDLVETNAHRTRNDYEYELLDTGAFAENRYFDVFVEYAKATEKDLCIKITAHNRGPETAHLHLLPTVWFRNTWVWEDGARKPSLWQSAEEPEGGRLIVAQHERLGTYWLYGEATQNALPTPLFCENETNTLRLFGRPNVTSYPKDGIHNAVVYRDNDGVNPDQTGTKASLVYEADVPAGESITVRLRLMKMDEDDTVPTQATEVFGHLFENVFHDRKKEADTFYQTFAPEDASEDQRRVQRQAYAGLIWTKQFYDYDIERWLAGDSVTPPEERTHGRNASWPHFSASDILSMPDKWEYPWFAAWDLAFHMIPFAQIDADFAKHQLLLLCREWYMHPNGQLPAYEWAFGDVNPPVHAWAALRLYKIERKAQGKTRHESGDVDFLERIFHKLLLNFTWWVNQKDEQGNNIFEGGFLGLDNIGVFDRSAPLPTGGSLEQTDGTAWMAMYCLNLLAIALELARVDKTYQDVATKFAEHFIRIAYALNHIGPDGYTLWDEEDGFYYDILHMQDDPHGRDTCLPLKIHSMVGLIPLFAVEVFDADVLEVIPDFCRRLEWFMEAKPHLVEDIAHINRRGKEGRALFSLVSKTRLRRILARALDETEFLSEHGIRSLSKYHEANPYVLRLKGMEFRVPYTPAESTTSLYGGNSNWRGPIWFPLNYLLIEALQKYDYVFGHDFTIECPTGSGNMMTLWEVSQELSRRVMGLFLRGEDGRRPCFGGVEVLQNDPNWRDYLLFNEYFHGDNGAGLGASHQTGWTSLVAKLITQSGR